MKRYVFSSFSFNEGTLTSKVIESNKSAFEVAKDEFYDRGWEPYGDIENLDSLKEVAYDNDLLFEIIEV